MHANTLNDLLDMAILAEVESQKFYLKAAQIIEDAKAKAFLNSLAEAEKVHERILEEVKDMEMYDGSLPVDSDALELIQMAHLTYDRLIKKGADLKQIFQIALKRELKACTLFQDLERHTPEVKMKFLYRSLAKEEMNHYRKIGNAYDSLTGKMGFEG